MSGESIIHGIFMDIPIAQPPWSGVGKKIESVLRKALYDFSMLESRDVAVALSGGKDSLTLLFMLKAVSGRGFPELNLSAVFVDGAFTCGAGVQTDYLKKICERLEVPLAVRRSQQKLRTLECYSCSRERRSLIFEAAKELGAGTVAFGHHREDNIETALMNMLHKGEFAGTLPKVGMERYGVTIIRPLIYVEEEQIRAFARQHRFLRILCQCPVGQNSLRKKTAGLIGELEHLYPNARANLARAVRDYGSDKALKP